MSSMIADPHYTYRRYVLQVQPMLLERLILQSHFQQLAQIRRWIQLEPIQRSKLPQA